MPTRNRWSFAIRARAHSTFHQRGAIYVGTQEMSQTFCGDPVRKLVLLTALAETNPRKQRAGNRLKQYACFRPREVDQAQPRLVCLIIRRAYNPVDSALQIPAAQEFERICDIHNDGIPRTLDILPRPFRSLHLEPSHGLVEQKRQRVVVRVSFGPDVASSLVLFPGTGMVLHVPQILEALGLIPVPLHKVLLVIKLQNKRKQAQEGEQKVIVDFEREVPYLVPVVRDDSRVRSLVLRRELGDVVALVVVAARELAGGLGLVAPKVTRGSVALVSQLLLQGQPEDRPTEGILPADFLVCETMADDVEKACGWV